MKHAIVDFNLKKIKKMSQDEQIAIKNLIIQTYIIDNLSKAQSCEKLNITKKIFNSVCNYFNIKKSKELITIQIKRDYVNKYGVENPQQRKEIREKTKNTCLDKYGYENPYQVPEIKEKIKQTNLKKYGVEYTSQCEQIKEKIKKTMLKKYGVDHNWKSEKSRTKMKKTMLKKYGVEYALQSNEIKENMKLNNIKKYGCKSPTEIHINEEHLNVLLNKDLFLNFINTLDYEDRTIYNVSKLLNVTFTTINNYAHTYNLWDNFNHNSLTSNLELQIILFLNENKIDYVLHDRSLIKPFEIDIWLPKFNFAIECNGNYWHSLKDKSYHKNKSLLAKNNNFFIFHLFEYELNNDNVINYLKNKLMNNQKIIYGRNCKLKEIETKKELDKFLNKYHIQQTCKNQKIKLGLYYNDELVQVMTFGKSRYDKNYEYELLRLCSHKDYKVVGGAEKLFKYFLKNYNPQSIISYCDFSKFSGDVYERLGMKFDKLTNPQLIWVKGNKYINESLLLKLGYDKLFNTNYGKGTSNEELMKQNGWIGVYNCGQLRYVYKSN